MTRSAMTKRLFDIFFSGIVLFFTAPLILIGMFAVKLTSPGPAFYQAKRAGYHGEPFAMFKLRTMMINTDAVDQRVTAENDSRITSVGKLLRATKLDELPQLLNVLRGDMSIVGPRPEDWDIVNMHYTQEQRRALNVRPGMVSPADVYWYPDQTYHDPPPSHVPMQEYYLERHLPVKLAQEIEYIEERTLISDMRVIWETLYCVVVYSLRAPKKRTVNPAYDHLGQRSFQDSVQGSVRELSRSEL